jgi:hypothetical protein
LLVLRTTASTSLSVHASYSSHGSRLSPAQAQESILPHKSSISKFEAPSTCSLSASRPPRKPLENPSKTPES